jgi:uncharacterized protein (DUF952 family)
MRRIFHLLQPDEWHGNDPAYRAPTLAVEGFAHCSNAEQVEPVANLFYPAVKELTALEIETDRLSSPVRDEDAGTGELFPHVYGPIDRAAVVAVHPLTRAADGRWRFDPALS